jgi:hypothetical protein
MKKILTILALVISAHAFGAEIWVSPTGNDANPGTSEKPLATVQRAMRMAREWRRLNNPWVKGGIQIMVADGVYRFEEPLLVRPEDSGTADSPTTIMAAVNAKPVFSGGVNVTGWKKASGNIVGLPSEAKGKVWVADAPTAGGRYFDFRQMWVNGVKATRASSFNDGTLDRILSVDKENQYLYIPNPKTALSKASNLELVIHQWWAVAFLRVKGVESINGQTRLSFYQPESRIEFEHPWPAPFIDEKKEYNGNSAFFFTNAIELLNSAGEWFYDQQTQKIYYWPRQNEDLAKADVVVPYLETIVNVAGQPDAQVSYVNFNGISFEHATWLRPSQAGHVPLQAGFYLLDAYHLEVPGLPDKAGLENQGWVGRQSAGVTASYANNMSFNNCTFQHMAGTGIDLVKGTSHNRIENCTVQDIGGTGIQVGFFGDETYEAHYPYNPADEREVCRFETITNNLVTDCTNEDWGCVGIGVGFAHDIQITHNEVSHVNYSGISLGWGWTKTVTCMKNNLVQANYIHHFAKQLYDVGGVYTLGAQPNTEISLNRIENLEKAVYAHIPNHHQYIYFDEGSSYIRAIDNWTERDKFFTNTNGPGTEWRNNGPQVSEEIKNAAGRLNAEAPRR